MKKVIVIGAGFAGLSAASHLAKLGYQVQIVEKNESAGGRASQFQADGFTFDMGPSWYWMPDVFEKFYQHFGYTASNFYELQCLDPGYRIFWNQNDFTDIPADFKSLQKVFESWEKGSGIKLEKYMQDAAYKYEKGIGDLVYKSGRNWLDFADLKLLTGLFKMNLFSSMESHVGSYFKHDRIQKILEFPIYFLGALPKNTPALYSLMNYADLKLKTWYPKGGMYEIVKAMLSIALEQNATIDYNSEVTQLITENGKITHVHTKNKIYKADIVVAAGDYHHIEQQLIAETNRQYSKNYWDKRIMAPSSLIFYLGLNKKVKHLQHHNLFFDESFSAFADEIYTQPRWPEKPLFYVSVPSITDPRVAPEGKENMFVLIPLASGLDDNKSLREKYFNLILDRIKNIAGEDLSSHIIYQKSFAHKDFESRYHAFKGNAYGLANTLFQTAVFKPAMKSSKLKNLYYTGQLTVPGPGVPPSIISGEVVSKEIAKDYSI